MMTPRQKYFYDNDYRQLVDYMIVMIDKLQFTPSEMREAAMLACVKHEEQSKMTQYAEFIKDELV